MSRNSRKCTVCGKSEYGTYNAKLFFATFPLEEIRCREWVRLLGDPELVFLPIEKLHTKKFVCGDHFEKKMMNKKGNRLNSKAVPRLNLRSAPLTDEQLKEFPMHIWNHKGHSFKQSAHSSVRLCEPDVPPLIKKIKSDHSTGKKIKSKRSTVSNPDHGYSRTNKHFDHTYHIVEKSTSTDIDSVSRDTPHSKHVTSRIRQCDTSADKSANDYDTKLSLSQHIEQIPQDTDYQLGGDEIVEDDQFAEVKEDGPFSWQQPSAVVPCEEEMLNEIDTGTAVDLERELHDPPEQPIEKGNYRCDVCSDSIVGFRYTCLQCADYDICGSCEARGAHPLHYVLRVPGQRPHAEVHAALLQIRRVLLADSIVQVTTDADMEVKEEPSDDVEDPIQAPSSLEHPTENYIVEDDQIAESSCDEESIWSGENLVALESSFEAEDEEMPEPTNISHAESSDADSSDDDCSGRKYAAKAARERTKQVANKQTDRTTSLSQHTIKPILLQPNIYEPLQRSVKVQVKKMTAAEIKSALHKS